MITNTNDIQHDVTAQVKKAARKPAKKAVKALEVNGSVTIKTPDAGREVSYNAANARAVAVLKVAKTGAYDLETITKKTRLPRRAVYHHLWCLRLAGMIKSERLGGEEDHELVFTATPKGVKHLAKVS